MVDSHCHLADEVYVPDLVLCAARAREAGVVRTLCILSADEHDELERVDSVRGAWAGVQFAVGIHPHRTGAFAGQSHRAAALLREAVAASRAVVIGEIGLDYHYDHAPRETQRELFAAQLEVAVSLGLPISVHTREAFADTLALIREHDIGPRSVIHCFSESPDDARRALDLGCYLSISGIVTFPKAGSLRDVAAFVPRERLLIETDGPFLAPVPLRGKRNEPAWVAHTLDAVASARRVDRTDLGSEIVDNFDRFVGTLS